MLRSYLPYHHRGWYFFISSLCEVLCSAFIACKHSNFTRVFSYVFLQEISIKQIYIITTAINDSNEKSKDFKSRISDDYIERN